ncbi:hypothetical protein J7413_00315 [Shimia sp. R10_1]|uniref:hypothetical protein n=1 Tax=Shimia sp. R10_1 TaxID=2821095 RepID=UPI001ADA49AD|nr:hypothetical protein [Shimia sp. R10_1]MBO9471969.1 hypothetical protein [Shimia sp. R10_1]
MNRCLALAFSAMIVSLPASSDAEDVTRPFTLSVGESVLGHTLEAGYRFNNRFGMRGMYGNGSTSIDTSIEGNTYDGDVALGGFGLIFDYYTSSNAFRLSAGAITLDHVFDGATTGSTIVNGTAYTAPLNVNARFDRSLAPMISMGVQTPIRNSRFVFTGDLGVVYTGSASAIGSDPTNTISQSDIDAELSDINETLDDLPIAPFVKVGIGFSF